MIVIVRWIIDALESRNWNRGVEPWRGGGKGIKTDWELIGDRRYLIQICRITAIIMQRVDYENDNILFHPSERTGFASGTRVRRGKKGKRGISSILIYFTSCVFSRRGKQVCWWIHSSNSSIDKTPFYLERERVFSPLLNNSNFVDNLPSQF